MLHSNTEKNKGSLWKVFREEDGTKFLRLYLLISDACRSPHVIISHTLAGFGGERDHGAAGRAPLWGAELREMSLFKQRIHNGEEIHRVALIPRRAALSGRLSGDDCRRYNTASVWVPSAGGRFGTVYWPSGGIDMCCTSARTEDRMHQEIICLIRRK